MRKVPRSVSAHPGKNIVDTMTFLTAPATVTVTVGATIYRYQEPAGVFNQQYPLANGTVSAKVER